MKPKILLINPPIYDFAAYDFWIKPYGLLKVGGLLRPFPDLYLFDYLDRLHPAATEHPHPACADLSAGWKPAFPSDSWGRGPYPQQQIPKPDALKDVPRYYRRFGMPRKVFEDYLTSKDPFDAVLIQTVMTYWYPGVKEVIDDIRRFCPQAKIALGGFYATACPEHAKALGADVVIRGDNFELLKSLGLEVSKEFQLPVWELYPKLRVGVLTLTQGCPFQCSYCFVPRSGRAFKARPLNECLDELGQLMRLGVENIAFYDDALLYLPQTILLPFLQKVIENRIHVNFHTPNALHARFITHETAEGMVRAGFKTFYLGFESHSAAFHQQTGSGKVVSDELATAVEHLLSVGADRRHITAYEMLGHPKSDVEQLEESMRFASGLGIQIMLSDFSPIPGTPDGDVCGSIVDLSEPLNHNKTAFPIRFLSFDRVNYYKDLCRKLNRKMRG
jgi:radical SAM superfamily enzyme YgiQ (UPF0313 family)